MFKCIYFLSIRIMDVVDHLFKSIYFDANIYLHSEFCSPWNMEADNPRLSSFHVIAYGNCSLSIEGKNELYLNAGDLIFFPRNIRHHMFNDNEEAMISTTLICGKLDFGEINNPVLDALPEIIHIKANEMDKYPWLKSLFQQIINEAEFGTEGSQIILDKLAEILFIYIVRYYIKSDQNDSANKQGLLLGLADKQICKVLMAMHEDLSLAWTVESLAEQSAMSRSSFSNKFSLLIGNTPLQYLTHLRMQCAHQKLLNSNESIISIALTHGYQSEAAFSKVFKKHYGLSPGKARKKKSIISD
ncbi:MAG: AraC family transcriptional regulator [Alcanivoracaceae bacterium]|nr:AraC family transcriptional regulator [Alcanivoracaceae bacterium]